VEKILVTGACGTLGRPLVKELRKRGHTVWGCDLHHQADPQVIRADIRSYRQLEQLLEQTGPVDYVYHLAAEFGRLNGEEYYETLWSTNVIGTRHILELQRHHDFKLIFASSSEIYGDRHEDVLRESIPLEHSIIQHNDYATTKWVNEIQIMNFERRFDSPIMRLRFFNAYGPGEYYHNYRSVICLFCYRALFDQPYTVYRGYNRVFMYIDDFIPTLANACEHFNAGEVFNVGGTEFQSVEYASNLILDYLRKDDSLITYLPEDAHNVQSKRPDISRAAEAFGHNPAITLAEGVPQTVEWMRSVYLRNDSTEGVRAPDALAVVPEELGN
jgi:dTDP-glucose 4,6-dehydratase